MFVFTNGITYLLILFLFQDIRNAQILLVRNTCARCYILKQYCFLNNDEFLVSFV